MVQETGTWDWESFSSKLEKLGGKNVVAAHAILDWAKRNHIEIWWSKSKVGSFIPVFYHPDSGSYPFFAPFSVWGNGMVKWNAPHHKGKSGYTCSPPFDNEVKRQELLASMFSLKGAIVDPIKVNKYSALKLPLHVLADEGELREFLSLLDWIKRAVEKAA